MQRIVLVHGIDNEREGEDLIRAPWSQALAGGLRLAGRDDLADRLLLPGNDPGRVDVRVAYYGHLFRTPDSQGADAGPDDLTPEQAALAEGLLREWLGRVVERAPDDSAVPARRALETADRQGFGAVRRNLLNHLAGLPFVARPGMAFAERFWNKALKQVTRYLTEPELREQVRGIVLAKCEEDGYEPAALIGHSLGSVVAYECAHRLARPLPLLTTLGSPLGLRTIVADRLDPPPAFPPRVRAWLNVANLEDVVAADPDLRPRFARDVPAPSRFDAFTYSEKKAPHRPETYLGREVVARSVSESLG